MLAGAKAALLWLPIPVYAIPLAALTLCWSQLHSRRAAVVLGGVGALAAGALFPLDVGLALALDFCLPRHFASSRLQLARSR